MIPARPALLLLAALSVSAVSRAENAPRTDSLFVSALAGHAGFSDNAGLDDAAEGVFQVGYRWTDRVSGELVASRLETVRRDPARNPADLDTFRADALWHYFRSGRWQPYAVAGIGQQAVSVVRREERATFLEAGLGLFRHLAGPVHLRLDTRAAWNPDDDSLRGVVAAGITIGFGGGYAGPQDPAHEFPR